MMGVAHRKAVEEIPPGLMHPDEKAVLFVLATETNDERLEWVHKWPRLLQLVGLHDDDAGRKWLQRRLRALEDAGWIERRPQPRLDGGRWGWGLIRLNFRETGDWRSARHLADGAVRPTPRAADGRRPTRGFDRNPEHRNTLRDESGRFTVAGQTDTGHPDKLIPEPRQSDTGPPDRLIPPYPDTPDIEPGHTRPIALEGSNAGLAIAINEARAMKARGVIVDGRPIESVSALGRFMYRDRPGYFDDLALKQALKDSQTDIVPETQEIVAELVEAFGFEEATA